MGNDLHQLINTAFDSSSDILNVIKILKNEVLTAHTLINELKTVNKQQEDEIKELNKNIIKE